MHRLFFALYPDPDVAARMVGFATDLRRRRGLPGRPVAAGRLHISLNYVGSLRRVDDQVVARARAVAAQVSAAPFAVSLDRVGTWGRGDGKRPVVLRADDGVIGAERLHRAIHPGLADAGLAPRAEPAIVPHVTLLRDPVEVPLEFTEPFRWTVSDFVLLDSPRDGGEHRVLGRWPLRATS